MPLSIKARCFNGQSYDLALDSPSATVTDLQTSISQASGITPDRQTILFKGQVLKPGSPLSEYSLVEGNVVNVVRRIGKSSARSAPPAPAPAPAPAPSPTSAPAADPEPETAPQPPSLDEMMRSLNMGGAPGLGTGPAGMPPDLGALLGGAGGAGLGGGLGAGAGAANPNMEQLLAQLPQMMNGLFQTPMMQEYLNDPDMQEQSRDAIMNNPLLKGVLENEPEFAKVVNDPEKWRASMEAAKNLLGSSGDGAPPAASTPSDANVGDSSGSTSRQLGGGKERAASKQSAADLAPPGIDIKKLSESYGHALGQSLVNSGLGLDPDLVIKGLKSAVDGKGFPMSLRDYERSMASLQNIATEFLTKANLEDANNFFEELKGDGQIVMLEEGKIAYEKGEVEVDASAAVAESSATVLVLVTAKLLDGRHFFTCPAADEKGESVHPLTLALETAPKALTKGIVGMRENESRVLYVHPTACEGMAAMFGDLLPPNALLIFDLQLYSANAPEGVGEETIGEAYYSG